MSQFLDRPVFKLVGEVAAERGVRAFVIGGYVRDCLLGRPCNDIDIVVEGSGIDFARAVGGKTGKNVSYFPARSHTGASPASLSSRTALWKTTRNGGISPSTPWP